MKVGDLVMSTIRPLRAKGQIGVVVAINDNGDCKVLINQRVFKNKPAYLEVI